MRARFAGEDGITLIEMLVAIAMTAIVMVGVVNLMLSGTRAGANANARLDAQQDTRTALDKLEFDGRCSSSATLISSGAGVHLVLPTQCTHATGNVTWCVISGVLWRSSGTSCVASGQPYIRDVTSATPFSLPTAAAGDLPQLAVSLTVDDSRQTDDGVTLTDAITLRNATPAS
jgi:Tfp pilus assembly protein PilW